MATPRKIQGPEELRRAASEKEFQAQVVELARRRGWRIYHPFDSRRSNPGFLDLVLVRGNRLIFAEVQAQRGKVSPQQDAWLDALDLTGAECYIWRPTDWPGIEKLLE
jgi:hypothetical protein